MDSKGILVYELLTTAIFEYRTWNFLIGLLDATVSGVMCTVPAVSLCKLVLIFLTNHISLLVLSSTFLRDVALYS